MFARCLRRAAPLLAFCSLAFAQSDDDADSFNRIEVSGDLNFNFATVYRELDFVNAHVTGTMSFEVGNRGQIPESRLSQGQPLVVV